MNSREIIHEQIAKYASGEASPEEAMQVEEWASESKENELYLANCFKLFNATIPNHNTGLEALVWKSIQAKIGSAPKTAHIRIKRWTVAIAASLLVAIATGLLFNNQRQHLKDDTFFKAGDVTKKIRLKDGTEILLNPQAKIATGEGYGERSRNITLQGSASFSVIHDSTKPFVVAVGSLHIKDLGTRFSVNQLASGDIIVTVDEGTVLVYENIDDAISLVEGEKIIYKNYPGTIESFKKQDTNPANKEQNMVKERAETPLPTKDNKKIKEKDSLVLSHDSLLNLTLAEVQEILGASASMTNSNKNKNNGVAKYSRQYNSVADASVNLYTDIEYFTNAETAHLTYERLRSQNSGAQNLTSFTTVAAEAFALTNKVNFYMVILQKQKVVYWIKINKLKPGVSIEALLKVLKRKAQAVK